MFAGALVDGMVDMTVTPQGILNLSKGEGPRGAAEFANLLVPDQNHSYAFESADRFVVLFFRCKATATNIAITPALTARRVATRPVDLSGRTPLMCSGRRPTPRARPSAKRNPGKRIAALSCHGAVIGPLSWNMRAIALCTFACTN